MRTGKIKQLLAHYIAGSDRSYRELWPAGKFARLLWLAARRFTADRNSLRAVALTYYTLFAIVPMLALAFGIDDFLFADNAISLIEWPERAEDLYPPDAVNVEIAHTGSENCRRITIRN